MTLTKAAKIALFVLGIVLAAAAIIATVTVLVLQSKQKPKMTVRAGKTRLQSNNNKGSKVGVVITTFGNNYVFAKQAVLCFLRHVQQHPLYLLLYVNGSDDERLLSIQTEFPEIQVVVLRQPARGGLTWTWNDGITKCLAQGCTTIVLSNDDVIFDRSILHILKASESAKGSDVYFGPLSNEPGNDTNAAQLGIMPTDKGAYTCTYRKKLQNLNGFFMVFPAQTLQTNMFDQHHFFNPSLPFGGNETEWFKRFEQKGGYGMVVPSTFIYHYKLKSWRTVHDASVCVYTINLNGYEGRRILLDNLRNNYDPADVLYFTDNDDMIYQCLKHNVQPFLVDVTRSGVSAKVMQRLIKAMPHVFLPAFYHSSIYVDGNAQLVGNVSQLLDSLESHPLICYQHWRKPALIAPELSIIVQKGLAHQESVNKIKAEMQALHFDASQHTLTETNMLVRKHHELAEFSEDWARLIRVCPRDQASFDFLLWKHSVNYDRRPFSEKPVQLYKHVNPVNRNVK